MTIGMLQILIAIFCFAFAAVMLALWVGETAAQHRATSSYRHRTTPSARRIKAVPPPLAQSIIKAEGLAASSHTTDPTRHSRRAGHRPQRAAA